MAVAPSPATSFTLRLAEPGDFDAYIDAFAAVAAEGRWLGAEAPVEREPRRPTFDAAVAGDDAVLYLAEVSGAGARPAGGVSGAGPGPAGERVVGAVHGTLVRGVVDVGMFVVDGYRGAGLGAALMEALIDWARSKRAHKISLAAWPTNHPAIGLYARYGFKVEGTRRRHYPRRSGALWDAKVMGLILDEESPGGPGPGKPEWPPIVLPDGGITGILEAGGPGGVAGVGSEDRLAGGGASGSRIVLRTVHRSDIPDLFAAVTRLEGRQWLTSIPSPYTVEHAEEWVATTRVELTAGTGAGLVIEVDGVLSGSVGLRILGPDGGSGEIGYWVATAARGRGVATTAARLLADFGLDTLGLRRIQLNAAVANTASRRVAEKAGFEFEGVRRAWRLVEGVPTDHALYSRIAEPSRHDTA